MNERLRELIHRRQIYDAWTLLHGAYETDVARFVRYRCGEATLADRCQDVWNAVYLALPTHAGHVSPRAWVLALAALKVDRRIVSPPPSLDRVLVAEGRLGLLDTRDRPRVARLLVSVADDDRELLELRHVSALRIPEIADLLAVTARVIERRLASAEQRLRSGLGGSMRESPRSPRCPSRR